MGGRLAVTAGAVSLVGTMAYAVRGRSSTLLAPSVYKGVGDRRALALTFDDGPSESTPELLEILNRHSIKATFFQCGANVRRLPRVAQEVALQGHEIGNHSDTHPLFSFKPPGFIAGELRRAQDSIRQAAQVQPVLFRPPFGVRWFGLRQAQKALGLTGVMWTAIGVDWKGPERRIAERLLKGAKNGAIFCLHDGRELLPKPDVRATIAAVLQLLPILMNQGFHFERVSEILCPTT